MKLFFVFNPKAGQEKIKAKLGDIIELFSYCGHEVTIAATTKRGDATEWVANLPEGYDRVICSGGDGTLDEVVEGMRKREEKLPIGYIPAGSTNDFASSVGIPSKISDAAVAAIGDNLFKCDLGLFNNKTFVYVAAFGAFTEVSYATPQELKNVLGHAAYLIEGMRHLNEIKPYHVKIEADQFSFEGDLLYAMITNSESVGGFKRITGPNVNLNDGLFEVTLVGKPGIEFPVVEGLTDQMNELTPKNICNFKTASITVESSEPIPWTLDGEFGGDEIKAEIRNLPSEFEIAIK